MCAVKEIGPLRACHPVVCTRTAGRTWPRRTAPLCPFERCVVPLPPLHCAQPSPSVSFLPCTLCRARLRSRSLTGSRHTGPGV